MDDHVGNVEENPKFEIQRRIEGIQKEIGPGVKILAVTKSRSIEEMQACLEAGIGCIGENRVQEAASKFSQLFDVASLGKALTVEKHLIGNLQTNKVKKSVELFDWIDSVDSLRLAQALNEEARKQNRVLPILIQVNVAQDPKKYGFHVPDLLETLPVVGQELPHLQVKGLMTILPYFDDLECARPFFRAMKKCFENIRELRLPGIEMEELSMGMSHDYRIAVEEGATVVRIGTAIFE